MRPLNVIKLSGKRLITLTNDDIKRLSLYVKLSDII